MTDGKNIRTLKVVWAKDRHEMFQQLKEQAEIELDQQLTDSEFLWMLLIEYETNRE